MRTREEILKEGNLKEVREKANIELLADIRELLMKLLEEIKLFSLFLGIFHFVDLIFPLFLLPCNENLKIHIYSQR